MPVARKTQEKTSFEQQERQKSSNKLSKVSAVLLLPSHFSILGLTRLKEKSDKSGAKKNRNTLFSEEPAAEGKSSSTAT